MKAAAGLGGKVTSWLVMLVFAVLTTRGRLPAQVRWVVSDEMPGWVLNRNSGLETMLIHKQRLPLYPRICDTSLL
jgi:hypothetical protein